MELTLMRHAEPGHYTAIEDRRDPGLSERGRQQAQRAAEYLAEEHHDALYSSPQRRARDTAAIVGEAVKLQAAIEPGLAEFDVDAPEYLHFEDLVAAGDDRIQQFLREDLTSWGTDADTFRARVVATLERIIGRHPGERVLLVTHGGVINAYLGTIIQSTRLVFHVPDYTALSRVRAGRSGLRSLVSVNETAHLRGAGLLGPPPVAL